MKFKSLVSRLPLLTAVAALAVGAGSFSMSAGANTIDATDSDLDGYTDLEEGGGMVDGLSTDPNKKDLRVYLVPDSQGSNLGNADPQYVLEYLGEGEQGLGLTVHPTNTRQVTDFQKAVFIREVAGSDSNPTGLTLGETPIVCHTNCASGATVYTQRIRHYLRSKCANVKCFDYFGGNIDFSGQLASTSLSAPPLEGSVEEKYIKHNLAHEAGHNMYLKNPQDRTVGFHYSPGTSGNIMDQFVYTKTDKKTKNVTWYIGTNFPSADKSSLKLK